MIVEADDSADRSPALHEDRGPAADPNDGPAPESPSPRGWATTGNGIEVTAIHPLLDGRAARNLPPSGLRRTLDLVRLWIRVSAVGVLVSALGAALAFGAPAGSQPAGTTITLTVPAPPGATVTVRVVPLSTANAIAAARDDPDKVAGLEDSAAREPLAAELRRLDAFLAPRPGLLPYRAHLWLVAHHSRPPIDARRLAALLWCTVWFPRACG
jgi:hypothetical protein